MILFHWISAAPWGSRSVHYKKSSIWRFFFFFPPPPLLATGTYRSSPRRQTYLVPSPSARNQEQRTHVLRKKEPRSLQSSRRHFICKIPHNLTLHNLTLQPYNLNLQPCQNLTKPYLTLLLYTFHLSEHWTLFWTLTYSLFVPFGV